MSDTPDVTLRASYAGSFGGGLDRISYYPPQYLTKARTEAEAATEVADPDPVRPEVRTLLLTDVYEALLSWREADESLRVMVQSPETLMEQQASSAVLGTAWDQVCAAMAAVEALDTLDYENCPSHSGAVLSTGAEDANEQTTLTTIAAVVTETP